MKVYIDADSCPSIIRDYIIEYGQKTSFSVVFVANRIINPKTNQFFEMIVCSLEKDSADNYIVSNAKGAVINRQCCADEKYGYKSSSFVLSPADLLTNGSDIVVTREILLAKRLTDKNVICMNDKGYFFTENNIEKLLKEREEDLQYVAMGLVKHSHSKGYSKKEFSEFKNSFSNLINFLK